MPKYVTLYNWTDQGAKSAKDTVNRYQAAKQLVESKGGKIETILWTVGPYDLVTIADFPDDETGTAVALLLASTGNLRSTTMRAFDEGRDDGDHRQDGLSPLQARLARGPSVRWGLAANIRTPKNPTSPAKGGNQERGAGIPSGLGVGLHALPLGCPLWIPQGCPECRAGGRSRPCGKQASALIWRRPSPGRSRRRALGEGRMRGNYRYGARGSQLRWS